MGYIVVYLFVAKCEPLKDRDWENSVTVCLVEISKIFAEAEKERNS